jgi:septum formation inhibitor MinC
MAKSRLSAEELLARRRERERVYNEKRKALRKAMSAPRVLLTEEEKRERKRARDRVYGIKRNKNKRSQVKVLAESLRSKMRLCRHEHSNGDVCGAAVAITSYYFCAKHRAQKDWGSEDTNFTLGVQNASF